MDELQLLISDDLDKVASLEAEMIDVVAALEDLAAQDGVCRANMASFECYLPEDYPLASFTKSPTHTNLGVAQVTLENRQSLIIAGIAVAVGALLSKLITWFMERYKRMRGDTRAQKTQEASKKLNDALKKVAVPPATLSATGFDAEITDLQDQFNTKYTGFAEVCLYAESFVQESYSLQMQVFDVVLPKVLEMGDYYERLLNATGDAMSLSTEVHTAINYFHVLAQKLRQTFKATKLSEMNYTTSFDGIVGQLINERNRLKEQPPQKTMTFVDFADAVGKDEPFIETKIDKLPDYHHRYDDARISRRMRDLEKQAKLLAKKRQPVVTAAYFVEIIKQLLDVIRSEGQAVIRFGGLLDEMENTELDFYAMANEYKRRKVNYAKKLEKDASE